MARPIESLDVSIEELEQLVESAGEAPLPAEGRRKLKAAVSTLGVMAEMLADQDTTIQKLRELLLPARTSEKTRKVVDSVGAEEVTPQRRTTEKRKKGHGRKASTAYLGAQHVPVAHPTLQRADRCPECLKGKVYPLDRPKRLVRIFGQAPLEATVYDLAAWRCNLCGEIFSAPAPAGVGSEKYDATAPSMIALLKYGSGLPFRRLQWLQSQMGIPLAAATQWKLVGEAAAMLEPVWKELMWQAAQGRLIHNDDTRMRILRFRREVQDVRTGLFTSGIVSVMEGHRIAVFMTGRQHAGENLADLLRRRAAELTPPIQMCDALSRNAPASLRVILANCLAHARRHFIDAVKNFPAECRHVLETLREVFHFDRLARDRDLTPEQRLQFHQEHSRPRMEGLLAWCHSQFDEHRVEPNSGLGKAIQYLRNHWSKLTLFFREAGAPLENNICERALKKAILHRKNALFYRTQNGAKVGDLFMSLIHTAELGGIQPFDYLTALLRNSHALKVEPSRWMPWNCRATLAESGMAA